MSQRDISQDAPKCMTRDETTEFNVLREYSKEVDEMHRKYLMKKEAADSQLEAYHKGKNRLHIKLMQLMLRVVERQDAEREG